MDGGIKEVSRGVGGEGVRVWMGIKEVSSNQCRMCTFPYKPSLQCMLLYNVKKLKKEVRYSLSFYLKYIFT